MRVHIKAKAAHAGMRLRPGMDLLEQFSEHAAAAELRFDIDTLNPPEIAIAPVTPLLCDHKLAGNLPLDFGDEIGAFGGIGEHGPDAATHAFGIELDPLGFRRDGEVEFNDGIQIGLVCLSN
jgi:hypothetical protein